MVMPDPTADPMGSPEAGLALLRKQVALQTELESRAARQRTLIAADDAGPLLKLLAERQELVGKLTETCAQFKVLQPNWESVRERMTEAQRTEAVRLLAGIKEQFQRTIERDEQDARLLAVRKQAVAGVLRTTHSTNQAIEAYRVPAEQSKRFDQVDERM
ncbi:MAG: hypothetical protein KJ749_07340 [Planctomycetes bacterium]|nr:hypothetical protein [Planctomycetota bacterium]